MKQVLVVCTQNAGGSIQNAIDAINNLGTGLNTVTVGAGIFNESLTVSENNFVLKGANAAINPNTGVRGAETIISGVTDPALYITGNKYFNEETIRERMRIAPASLLLYYGRFSQTMLARDVQSIESL